MQFAPNVLQVQIVPTKISLQPWTLAGQFQTALSEKKKNSHYLPKVPYNMYLQQSSMQPMSSTIYIYIYMYVCVCIYIYMYVCMYVFTTVFNAANGL